MPSADWVFSLRRCLAEPETLLFRSFFCTLQLRLSFGSLATVVMLHFMRPTDQSFPWKTRLVFTRQAAIVVAAAAAVAITAACRRLSCRKPSGRTNDQMNESTTNEQITNESTNERTPIAIKWWFLFD